MIKVTKYKEIKKGALIGICEFHDDVRRMTFREVKIFEKAGQRWIGLPNKEFTNKMGEKKYMALVKEDDEIKEDLRKQVLDALQYFKLTDCTVSDEYVPDEEVPF